jgi:hypothetical protein
MADELTKEQIERRLDDIFESVYPKNAGYYIGLLEHHFVDYLLSLSAERGEEILSLFEKLNNKN